MASAGLLAAALGGCSMDLFGSGPDLSQQANTSASPAQVAQGQASALPAIATECPPIKARPGAEALFNYGGARSGTSTSLHYQIELERETRNCVVSNGLITVKMGVVGRVLLGPMGKESSFSVPLRFTVERNGTAVFSEKYVIPVSITPPAQSAEFVKVVDNVAIPYLGGEDIRIWVGLEGQGTRAPSDEGSLPRPPQASTQTQQ
ncbi:MAG: hypothetical protein ACTHOR_16845 [Devosia sp.]